MTVGFTVSSNAAADPEKVAAEIHSLKKQRRDQAKHFEKVIADVNADAKYNEQQAKMMLGQLDAPRPSDLI